MNTNNRFYLIDKPVWISSFDVIRQLRKKLQIKKMGHTGTLDPLASGLLLVAVWNYTKLIPYLEKSEKEYEYTLNLSWVTESMDMWEDIEAFDSEFLWELEKSLTKEEIEDVVKNKFLGHISQIPPKYSALKINWKRAYELAREWKEVEIKKRDINVLSHELLSFDFPEATLKARVSAGSYIRSLAYDIGCEVWEWAFVTELRRTWMDNLTLSEAVSLDNFDENKSLDLTKLFDESKFIELEEWELKLIKMWLFIQNKDFMKEGDEYFVMKDWNIVSVIEVRKDEFKAKVNIN